MDIAAAIKQNKLSFSPQCNRMCLQLCEVAAGFKNGRKPKTVSQLESFGRVSKDFTDCIDTDEEKLNFSVLMIRIARNEHRRL